MDIERETYISYSINIIQECQKELELFFNNGFHIFEIANKTEYGDINKFNQDYNIFVDNIEYYRKKFNSLKIYAEVVKKNSFRETCNLTLVSMVKILEKNINRILVDIDVARYTTEEFIKNAEIYLHKIRGYGIESKSDIC